MSLQIRRGPTTDRLTITPASGELIYDTTEKTLYVGDGTTVGGISASPTSPESIEDISSSLFTNGIHSGITYQYDDLNNRINSTVDLSNYTAIMTANGFQGNVYAYDNTLLIDASLKGFQLDGTVRSNIVPFSNSNYDIGSSSNRFRDLYLSGNSIYLGNAVIGSTGSAVDLPAGSTVGGSPIGGGGGVVPGDTYQINIAGNDNQVMVDTVAKTVTASGGIIGNLSGSVIANDATVLVDSATKQIRGDFVGKLGGNLDVNNFTLTSSTNIVMVPQGFSQFGSTFSGRNGNIVIRRSSYTGGGVLGTGGFLFEQFHNDSRTDRMVFYKSRGSYASPLPVQSGDRIGEIAFLGNTASNPFSLFSASMRAVASADPVYTPTGNLVPTDIEFRALNDPNEVDARVLIISSEKKVLANRIEGLSTTLSVVGDLIGNVTGSIFSDDSTRIIDGTDGSITAGSFVQFGSLTSAQRDALSAVNGMVIYNTSNNRFEGYQNGAWINLDDGTPAGA